MRIHACAVLASAVSLLACGQRAPAHDAGDTASIRAIAGGRFEASGLVAVPGSNLLLFSDDGRGRDVLAIALGADGTQQGAAIPIRTGADVTDAEGMTTDGTWIYVVGSQSKRTGHEGDGLVRFRLDPATRAVSDVQRVRGLKGWLARNVPELHGTEHRLGDEVLNIEALAWDPVGERLLLGLRAPVADGMALVVPVRLVDSAAALAVENLRADSTIRLDLGGAGIRGLEHDVESERFLVITGASLNAEGRDFQLLEWDANSVGSALRARTDSMRVLATYPRRLKPEGVARIVVDGRALEVIVFDTGYLRAVAR